MLDAISVRMSATTMVRYYGGDIVSGRPRAKAQMGNMLFTEAIKNKSIPAARLWLELWGDKPVRDREEKSGKLTLADLMRDAPE